MSKRKHRKYIDIKGLHGWKAFPVRTMNQPEYEIRNPAGTLMATLQWNGHLEFPTSEHYRERQPKVEGHVFTSVHTAAKYVYLATQISLEQLADLDQQTRVLMGMSIEELKRRR